ncbi:uncharacterized protein LOC130441410 isoform X1 [Diorhabda sublineata]|uniref:uncharacterized protein LOC130441410 isoform X1 n=2 Tax=Diorhabda sublineata TaxID=1163346 RepID=UPI0024E171E0|nr:uncharacterized protein LOC130441410 isoform X1 [Diorhabda sublineata]
MAQPQYYEILNEGGKNPEQQFFTNVEDQTVQYVITPDTTQVQFPNQQITQDQVLQTQIIHQPIIQQPIQIQAPQYALLKDGTLRTTEGQQIFFVGDSVSEGIVIEKPVQLPPQPIVLNHQLAHPTVVRGSVMKTGPNQQILLESTQKQKGMQRPQTPNQQVRQLSPSIPQIRQQIGITKQSSPQGHSPQTQLRPQQQNIRPSTLTRTGQTQFRPQPQTVVRQTDPNQRQHLRMPSQTLQHRPNLVRGAGLVNTRMQGIVQQHQVQQSAQPSKFTNQAANENEVTADDQETVTLPDGMVVTMASYKKMLADQKARNNPQKQNVQQQQTNQIQGSPSIQQPQQNMLMQPNNPLGSSNIRPQLNPIAKKGRNPVPRVPRLPVKNVPRLTRPRAPLANQQPNNQEHFSMLSQQQQMNKQQTQQFQTQGPPPQMTMMQQQQSQNNQHIQQQNQLQQQQQLQQQNQFQQQNQLQQQRNQQAQLQAQQQQRNNSSHANYIIQPPKLNQKPSQQRRLPAYIPSSQIQKIIESTPIGDDFPDSIRMLVLLENGEQRLITFTLPKEPCTIQEILEQVNVPFQADTRIQVIETNSNGINYIVTVGNVANLGFKEEETPPPPPPPLQEHPPTSPTNNSAPLTNPLTQPHLQQMSKMQTPKTVPTPTPVQAPVQQTRTAEVPQKSPSPEPVKEIPKFLAGMLALCGACGYLSEDFNRCIRCSRKLPDNVKAIPANMKGNSETPKRNLAAVALAQQQKHQALQQQQQNQQPKINTSPATKVAAGSPQKKKSGRPPKNVEESVHVISSDEEEDEEEKPKFSENLLQKLGSSVTISPISKEPSTIDIQRHCSSSSNTSTKSLDEKDLSTKLKCRTVRIGTYRCTPSDEIVIDSLGVTMKVPHPNKEKGVCTITLNNLDVVKVLASFNSSLPVIFYYINTALAAKVRMELDMTSDSEYYLDPLTLEEEAQRRITLLPDDNLEEQKETFELIYSFPVNILEELNIKEANDILIKTCPKDLVKPTPGYLNFTKIKQLMIYPPEGRYRITINTEDYICLGQDQFLNDVIIDFYLTYLVDNLPPEQKEKIHVFSTFFYRRLTTKPVKASRKSQPSELDPTLTPAQKRHARVKKWTKNVNIFEKDFIIVPINENAHWFLAIICFPGMDGPHTWDDKPYNLEVNSKKKKKTDTVNIGNLAISIKQEKLSKPISCDDPELSDKDEAEGDDSEMESDGSEEIPIGQPAGISVSSPSSTPTPKLPKETRPQIKQPCILIFDSLAGSSRCRVVATLRDYLTCEYKSKMGSDKNFNKDVIKGASPKVPQQNNFTDCGLYLLQYVEQFLKDPIKDFHIPIKEIQNWFEEIVVTRKREDIANLIKSLMKKYGKDLRLVPYITFPTYNGEIVKRDLEDEEEDEEMMGEEEEDEYFDNQRSDSMITFNSSKDTLSDTVSSENDIKMEETNSPIKPSTITDTDCSDFVTQPVLNPPKPDISEFPRQTNKDTLSILKAKRIIKHKTLEGPLLKKHRNDEQDL